MKLRVMITVLVVLAGVALAPTIGAQTPDSSDWTYGSGVLTIDSDMFDSALTGDVEVWTGDNGRYRVVTMLSDGTRSEVAYGGQGIKTVMITDPAGDASALQIRAPENFAVLDASLAADLGYDVTGFDGDRVTSWKKSTDHATTTFELTSVGTILPIGDLLELQLPPGVEIPEDVLDRYDERSPVVGAGGSSITGAPVTLPSYFFATGSASVTLVDIYTYQACVYGYNFRNNVSNFFTTNSQRRGDCSYVVVSAWGKGLMGSGTCHWPKVGYGPSAAYSSWTGYYNPSGSDRMCSNHGGWNSADVMIVPWSGLDSSISG